MLDLYKHALRATRRPPFLLTFLRRASIARLNKLAHLIQSEIDKRTSGTLCGPLLDPRLSTHLEEASQSEDTHHLVRFPASQPIAGAGYRLDGKQRLHIEELTGIRLPEIVTCVHATPSNVILTGGTTVRRISASLGRRELSQLQQLTPAEASPRERSSRPGAKSAQSEAFIQSLIDSL